MSHQENPLCLRFANTSAGSQAPDASRLEAYAGLLDWCEQVGILTSARRSGLTSAAAARVDDAGQVLGRVAALRRAIRSTIDRIRASRSVLDQDLAVLNGELARSREHYQLVPKDEGFTLGCAAGDHLDRMLWPIARSVAELLTSEQLHQVRECDAENCPDLFVDTSRNRRRRWCDMKVCGNRAKARRHRRKKQGGAGS